jgi:choline dehydrogenase-like flavoprotein
MSVSYVPWTLAMGARIFASCRARHVEVRGGRAVGVVAETTSWRRGEGKGRRVHLRARRGVFVAASTIQTPNLLRRSGLRARAIGQHFQVHPGLALSGLFDTPIRMDVGATQGAESLHFRKTDRFKLETIGMPPELAVARVPGVGREFSGRLSSYANLAVWAAQIRAEGQGTISRAWDGRDRVRFNMTPSDMHHTRKAAATIAGLLFDAGAREVWPGIYGVPPVLRSRDEVKLLEDGPVDSQCYNYIASHLFGAARMGPDPRTSAVGLDFATHEVRALYVVDSSIFPTNLGVNPQHSIMALSRLAATRVASATLREVAA